jgi:hypothetical protein
VTNVGGLLATSSDIDNNRFMSGDYTFDEPGNPAASILNTGHISAADYGLVALAGSNVTNSGTIRARLGRVHLASGDTFGIDLYGDGLINLQASDAITSQLIRNSGTISASGGNITLTKAAARNVVDGLINTDGLIEADGVDDHAGSVTLYSNGGTTLVSGSLDARGTHGGEKGGTVEVLGNNVGVLAGASIDTSGSAGGGTVRIGGDFHGAGTTPTASRTVVQGNTLIKANAVETGKGGDVTVWADERTDFAGRIEARGGTHGGDGGFVETSGKQLLAATGLVDTSSPWGKAGVWLLDPNNITIQAAGVDTNVTGSPSFTTTDDNAIVTTGSIQAALNAGTSVMIQTGSAGTNAQAGDITVASAISKTAGGDASLTLKAANSILVNSDITSNSNKLNITLNADSDASGAGAIVVTGATLNSNGGNIILGGGTNPLTTPAYGTAAHTDGILLNGETLNAAGGNITLNGTGYSGAINSSYGVRALNGSVVETTGTGGVTITGTAGTATNRSYGVRLDFTGSTVSTADGDITITGTGGAGSDSEGVVVDGLVQSTGRGNITITGTGADSSQTSYGVLLSGNGYGTLIVSSVDGDISITGTGGSSFDSEGISSYELVQSSGHGSITMTGTGGTPAAGDSDSAGLWMDGGSDNNPLVLAADGDIRMTGSAQAGSGTTYGNQGFYLTGGKIFSANGNLSISGTLTGTGSGVNYGIWFDGPFVFGGGATTVATGGGSLSLTAATQAGVTGIKATDNSSIIGGATEHGDVVLAADSFDLQGAPVQTTGNLTLKPRTAGTTVGVGTGSGALSIDDATLGTFSYGSLTIGGASAGAMDINSGVAFAAPVTFQTGNGYDITLSAPLSSSAGGTAFTLASGGNYTNNAGAFAFNLTGGGRFLVYSTKPALDTLSGLGYDFSRFGCTYGGSCPAFPTSGNGLLYRLVPVPAPIVSLISVSGNPYGTEASDEGGLYTNLGYPVIARSAFRGVTVPTRPIYADAVLLDSLGYSLSTPKRWWDAVIADVQDWPAPRRH